MSIALTPGSAWADDDDLASEASGGPPPLPRVSLQSGDIELVAEARGRKLYIYLDRFADNTPESDAEIEVDVEDKTLRPAPVANGLYLLTDERIAAPGQHDITFTVTTGQGVAILSGTLMIPSPKTGAGEVATGGGTASASPLKISLPIDAVLAVFFGMLAAIGFSALAIFRLARARASIRSAEPSTSPLATAGRALLGRLFALVRFATARPRGWIVATLVVLFVLALLLLGRGMLTGEAGARYAPAGVGTDAR